MHRGATGSIAIRHNQAPDPADARLLTAAEFRQSDLVMRRRVMMAWAFSSPEDAGPALLPLIDAALQDADQEVRWHAVATLQRAETKANVARLAKRPVATDPRSYPALFKTLWNLLDDPDGTVRQGIVSALTSFEVPPGETLTAEFLNRLATERYPEVRVRMVTALAQSARNGSGKALAATLAALDDSDARVQLSAVNAMRHLRRPEALPRLIQLMSVVRPPPIRRAVVQTLAAYGAAAQSELPTIRAQLLSEMDPAIKAELQRLVDRLDNPPSASRD